MTCKSKHNDNPVDHDITNEAEEMATEKTIAIATGSDKQRNGSQNKDHAGVGRFKLTNDYKKIQIIAMIRVNGKKICYKMYTWMKPGHALHEGEKVMIRYRPGTHHVWVKQIAA